MQTSTTKSRLLPDSRSSTVASYSWLMLASRSILFVLFQILIALILAATGRTSVWAESARWWTFMAFLANFTAMITIASIFLFSDFAYRL